MNSKNEKDAQQKTPAQLQDKHVHSQFVEVLQVQT